MYNHILNYICLCLSVFHMIMNTHEYQNMICIYNSYTIIYIYILSFINIILIILYYIILYYIILYYIILYYIVLYYIILNHIKLYYIILYYIFGPWPRANLMVPHVHNEWFRPKSRLHWMDASDRWFSWPKERATERPPEMNRHCPLLSQVFRRKTDRNKDSGNKVFQVSGSIIVVYHSD